MFQLEQMEIETREIPLKERDRYQTRLQSYHAELSKLEKDLVGSKLSFFFRMFWFWIAWSVIFW